MKFDNVDQYQDHTGDIVLRFTFLQNSVPIVHTIKKGSAGDLVVSLSVNENNYYKPAPFVPNNMQEVITACCAAVGGKERAFQLLKEGIPTRVGIPVAV
jgi:hypothetical protein